MGKQDHIFFWVSFSCSVLGDYRGPLVFMLSGILLHTILVLYLLVSRSAISSKCRANKDVEPRTSSQS
jgi:hypothetical protein